MNHKHILGIDGGASKVFSQLYIFKNNNTVIDQSDTYECRYDEITGHNQSFSPVSLNVQKKEMKDNTYKISNDEKMQAGTIIKAIVKSIGYFTKNKIDHLGFCFPGIKMKEKDGISIMANGPRNPYMLKELNENIAKNIGLNIILKKIYDDSLSCVNGERFSPKGKLKEVSDAIYIGGGTGIADGILYNKKLIDLNMYKNLKKSWEIIMPNGDTIEECISLAGLCKKWKKRKPISIELLNDLFNKASEKHETATDIIKTAGQAFQLLINERINFFKAYNRFPEKIVIGQRMGQILKKENHPLKIIFDNYNTHDIPIELSSSDNTAALGAAQYAINE